jgi:hypothetical protein
MSGPDSAIPPLRCLRSTRSQRQSLAAGPYVTRQSFIVTRGEEEHLVPTCAALPRIRAKKAEVAKHLQHIELNGNPDGRVNLTRLSLDLDASLQAWAGDLGEQLLECNLDL